MSTEPKFPTAEEILALFRKYKVNPSQEEYFQRGPSRDPAYGDVIGILVRNTVRTDAKAAKLFDPGYWVDGIDVAVKATKLPRDYLRGLTNGFSGVPYLKSSDFDNPLTQHGYEVGNKVWHLCSLTKRLRDLDKDLRNFPSARRLVAEATCILETGDTK